MAADHRVVLTDDEAVRIVSPALPGHVRVASPSGRPELDDGTKCAATHAACNNLLMKIIPDSRSGVSLPPGKVLPWSECGGVPHRIDHLLTEGPGAVMPELETSGPATTKSPPGTGSVTDTRLLAAQLFNETWRRLEHERRTRPDDDRMIHAAHASRYHWGQVPAATPAHLARGEWLISRVYSVLGRTEPALHHAQRVLDLCQENSIGDFDLAFAYEALARAHAVAGGMPPGAGLHRSGPRRRRGHRR